MTSTLAAGVRQARRLAFRPPPLGSLTAHLPRGIGRLISLARKSLQASERRFCDASAFDRPSDPEEEVVEILVPNWKAAKH